MTNTHSTAQVVPFNFDNISVRAFSADGQEWLYAPDVTKALALRDTTSALKMVDDEDKRTFRRSEGPQFPEGLDNRVHEFTAVNESGMYALVFQSNKPEAKKFRRWVTSDVLPTIRKTGSYSVAPIAPALTLEQQMAVGLEAARQIIEAKDQKIAELEPKAEFYDELMDADGTYPMLAAAHILGWGRNVMMAQLRRLGILQSNNLPYRRYDHHFKVTPGTYVNRKTGETVPTATTSIRPSGLGFLRKKLSSIPEPVQLELVGADA